MNNVLAIVLAGFCFIGFVLLVDKKRRAKAKAKLDELKKK